MIINNTTLVVPTYNMSTHIHELWESIKTSGLIDCISEVIFVNDCSTDDTLDVLTSIEQSDSKELVKILNLDTNKGRFIARYLGAIAASNSQILFLDSRIILPDNFGSELSAAIKEYPNIVGSVDIDTSRNVFCLYWERTHKKIFRKHYENSDNVIVLDENNYDEYLKGTTVFFCQRDVFISSCEKYKDMPLLNDDTYLMKEMVRHQSIAIHPKVRISWVPRENLRDFLLRMWERGPSFVEYHVFSVKGLFFYIVTFTILLLMSVLSILFIYPTVFPFVVVSGFLFMIFSTALFAHTVKEFFMMSPIHVLSMLTFGLGVIYGIFVNVRRLF